MRASVGFLLLLSIGCAPARSEHTATAPPPRVTASTPASEPAPEVATADASIEPVDDGGPFGFAIRDAASEPAPLSPPLTVAFGVIEPQNRNAMFNGQEILLFKRRVTCGDAAQPDHPDRVFSLSIEWKTPNSSEITNISIKNGTMTTYRAHVDILSAPTRAGALGKIRLATGPDYNVGGGEVPVLVCQ